LMESKLIVVRLALRILRSTQTQNVKLKAIKDKSLVSAHLRNKASKAMITAFGLSSRENCHGRKLPLTELKESVNGCKST
jgi:hypothetical protein